MVICVAELPSCYKCPIQVRCSASWKCTDLPGRNAGASVTIVLKSRYQARLLNSTRPQMIHPVRRPGKPHIRYQNDPALLQRGGQLYECLCFDSHRWLLVRNYCVT